MDNTGQRTVPKLQRNRAYMILTYARSSAHHANLNIGLFQAHGVYMDFEDAFDGFLPAVSPEQRDKHPFRNKIGELCESGGLLGWGYSWIEIDPALGETMARWMWIEKTLVHRREGETGEGGELSAAQLELLEAEGGIDYEAVGQRTPIVPVNAVFDEATQDFIFDGEDDGGSGGDQMIQV